MLPLLLAPFGRLSASRALLRATLLLAFAGGVVMPAQAQQTIQERDDIRARKIRRVTEWRQLYGQGQIDAKGSQWGYREYDRRGNLVVTGRLATGEVVSPMYVREYDAADRPVKRTWYCDRTEEQPAGKPCLIFRGYRLDQHGNVVEENGYDLDGNFVARVSFKRDAAGRPLEREDSFGDGSPRNRSYRYRYNERGDATETRTFDGEGKLTELRHTDYEYDEQGRAVEWTTTDAAGKTVSRGQHGYDRSGNRVESVDLDATGQPIRQRRFTYEFWD